MPLKILQHLTITIFSTIGGASAQPLSSHIEQFLQDRISDPHFIELVLDQHSVPERLRPVYEEYVISIWQNESYISAIANEIGVVLPTAMELQQDQIYNFMLNVGLALSYNFLAEGVPRMPVSDQRRFLQLGMNALQSYSSRDCAQLALGTLDAQREIELENLYIFSRPIEEVRLWLSLKRSAFLRGLERSAYVPLTRSEVQVADSVYFAELLREMEYHENYEALISAALDPEHARPEDLCQATILGNV